LLGLLLFIIAVAAWYSVVGQGISCGAVLGLSGRDQDLVQYRFGARSALLIALPCEALAVGILSWAFEADAGWKAWVKLAVCVAFALAADLTTWTLIRP